MKSLVLILIIFMLSLQGMAQQFSFQIVFRDANGNGDTLVLGYDDNGTNGIDAAFGEQNIVGNAYQGGLDVRASNLWWKDYANAMSYLQGTSPHVDAFINAPAMQSKTQIVKNTHSCTLGSIWKGPFNQVVPIIELNIKTDAWPVTAYWNSTDFANPCRNGSVMTSMHPGAWWDGGFNKLKAELRKKNMVTFYQSTYSTPATASSASLPVYWLAFGDSSLTFDDIEMEWLLLNVKSPKQEHASVFPNPTTGKIHIRTSPTFGDISHVRIYDAIGKLVQTGNKNVIDLSAYDSGMYLVEITNREGLKTVARVHRQ